MKTASGHQCELKMIGSGKKVNIKYNNYSVLPLEMQLLKGIK